MTAATAVSAGLAALGSFCKVQHQLQESNSAISCMANVHTGRLSGSCQTFLTDFQLWRNAAAEVAPAAVRLLALKACKLCESRSESTLAAECAGLHQQQLLWQHLERMQEALQWQRRQIEQQVRAGVTDCRVSG